MNADAIDLMAALAVESRFDNLDGSNDAEFEEQKRVNLAKHRRAVKNNMLLFQSGDIDDAEYFRQKDFHERQIVYWESRTSDRQKITLELTTCREMVKRIQQFWDITTGEDRRILAQSLFDEVVYDLDARRIVDFRIKAWAEPFLELRAALYADDMGEEMKNRFNSGVSSDGSYFSPNGASPQEMYLEFGGINRAKKLLLFRVYHDQDYFPQLTSEQRNQQIRQRYQAGEAITALAHAYSISPQRVHQIVKPRR
ncbi:MAG: hypothetical protein K8L97_17090 [Anaerolineae bacterium]|nr:hypothetical protein [Anaerolineae bacterium]